MNTQVHVSLLSLSLCQGVSPGCDKLLSRNNHQLLKSWHTAYWLFVQTAIWNARYCGPGSILKETTYPGKNGAAGVHSAASVNSH